MDGCVLLDANIGLFCWCTEAQTCIEDCSSIWKLTHQPVDCAGYQLIFSYLRIHTSISALQKIDVTPLTIFPFAKWLHINKGCGRDATGERQGLPILVVVYSFGKRQQHAAFHGQQLAPLPCTPVRGFCSRVLSMKLLSLQGFPQHATVWNF